jgi:hypothetical protein
MMSELYNSLDEKNAKSVINIVTKAVKDDKVALSDEDIIRLTNETRCTKQTMLVFAIFLLVSLASYFFIEFNEILLFLQIISLIIFLWCGLFSLHYGTILFQGHWN